VVVCSLGGESWDGEEEGEIGGRGSVEWWYINFYRWNHQRTPSIGDFIGHSDGELVTSLYGDPGLNSSVISYVKSPAKTSTSLNCFFFFLNSSIYSVYNSVGVGIYRLH
jgi:hypothetical protein